MNVQKVESIAVPTALAAVGAGVAAYSTSRTITKSGELSDEFVRFLSCKSEFNDLKIMLEADSLDKIGSILPTDEEIRSLGTENFEAKFKKLLENKTKNYNKTLENFVIRNSEALGIQKEKGQSLREAAKEFIKGKSIEEIKEAFLPTPMRRAMENMDYDNIFRESFAEVYDSAAKKFKTGEAVDETVRMFKRSARQLRFAAAGVGAGIIGGTALISSAIASKIANK